MCGIFGTTKNIPESTMHKLDAVLQHRGPDAHSTFQDDAITITHYLLSIRGDVTESIQPVHEDGSDWILAFNGQIYNTKEVKELLGNAFQDIELDTVLLYALIKQYGWDFIQYIHGMYAIALYNKRTQEVRLYRDPTGQKTLYYTTSGDFTFCSEIKGVRQVRPDLKHINKRAVAVAAHLGYVPGDMTLVESIEKLNPSEMLVYDCKKRVLNKAFYRNNRHHFKEDIDPRSAIRQTIAENLQSKREIGINLSGGLDSSLILHEASEMGYKLNVFSTVFNTDDATFNEDAEIAKRLAKEYGHSFAPIHIDAQTYNNNFVESYASIEEPNYNISIPAYFQVAKEEGVRGAKQRVIISGDGGDELFGGYAHYLRSQKIQFYKKFLGMRLFNFYKTHRQGDADFANVYETLVSLRGFKKQFVTEPNTKDFTTTYLRDISSELLKLYGASHKETWDFFGLMLLDRFVWLASENFIRSDKLFMSNSIELRSPLAYQPLRTYMDATLQKKDYINRRENKAFLRKLYRDVLPDYVTKRRVKSGWRAPAIRWQHKGLKEIALELVSTAREKTNSIDWNALEKEITKDDHWFHKSIFVYLSIAALIDHIDLED